MVVAPVKKVKQIVQLEKVARQIAFQWSGDNDLPKSRWLESDKTDCSKVGFYESHLGDGSILLKSEING
jgi:hypothetical protein